MDASTFNSYFSNILAALTFGYAVWTKFSARRATQAANAKADEAVNHSQVAGATAETNRQDIDDLRQQVAAAKSQTDESTARYIRTDALLRIVPQRLESQRDAILWLADRLGRLERGESPDEDTTERDDDGDSNTGRHRLPTQAVQTIQEDA